MGGYLAHCLSGATFELEVPNKEDNLSIEAVPHSRLTQPWEKARAGHGPLVRQHYTVPAISNDYGLYMQKDSRENKCNQDSLAAALMAFLKCEAEVILGYKCLQRTQRKASNDSSFFSPPRRHLGTEKARLPTWSPALNHSFAAPRGLKSRSWLPDSSSTASRCPANAQLVSAVTAPVYDMASRSHARTSSESCFQRC